MAEPRHPGDVPDVHGPSPEIDKPEIDTAYDITYDTAYDTDGDGRPDTVVTGDGVDLVLLTDIDGDRFADQVLRIGPDGVVREAGPPPPAGPGAAVVDGLLGGADAGW